MISDVEDDISIERDYANLKHPITEELIDFHAV